MTLRPRIGAKEWFRRSAPRRGRSLLVAGARWSAFGVLAMVALTMASAFMQTSSTLWAEELTLHADISTGVFDEPECRREVANAAYVTNEGGESTTYSFDFVVENYGEGTDCQGVSNIHADVCFDPEIVPEGDVIATTQPTGWQYSPRASSDPKQIKWDVTGGSPADGTYSFSFTVPGDPEMTTALLWKAGLLVDVAGVIYIPVGDCLPEGAEGDGLQPVTETLTDPEVVEPLFEVPDGDGDGVEDAEDNCPDAANADQKDINHNGIGDICEDADGPAPDVRSGDVGTAIFR